MLYDTYQNRFWERGKARRVDCKKLAGEIIETDGPENWVCDYPVGESWGQN